jgi:hypothetical protein
VDTDRGLLNRFNKQTGFDELNELDDFKEKE